MKEKGDTFRVDQRLLVELGERLISRDEVAIVELVKNAYDADAKRVEIIIENGKNIKILDNGTGMDMREIREGWLTLGTGIKKRNTKTPSGRRVLGEKGLGRLAVLRLGGKVTIYTRKKGSPCYSLMMDWGEARRRLDRGIYTPISKTKVLINEIEDCKSFFPSSEYGTMLEIENLETVWDDEKTDRLRLFLARLVEPEESESSRFKICLTINGKRGEINPQNITKKPHYCLEADVDEKGNFKGNLEWNVENEEGQEEIKDNISLWKTVQDGGTGSFRFKVKVWDLDVLEKGMRSNLRDWTGISLVRDSFRVVQPDIDWLGLNLRRVQNPTMRLSTNQLMGSVFISSDENKHIIDKTDREGVVENEAVTILKASVAQLLDILERKRKNLRKGKALSRGTIFQYLDTAPLKYLARTLPPAQRKEIEGYVARIDEFRQLLEEWILGRDRMATMGMLGARLIHEARSALMKITDNYPLIEKHLNNLNPSVHDHIMRMVEGGRVLSKIFTELDPFLKFRQQRRKDINLRQVVESLVFLFGPEIKKQKIILTNRIPQNITFKAGATDIYVVLANLLDNSIYWLAQEPATKKRIIELRASEENTSLIMNIADSGPGINPEIADSIFEAGSTTKPNGTGLGLAIVRDIIDFYGGKVEVTEDKTFGGALFRIELPYRIK